jgi:hypothetical protein
LRAQLALAQCTGPLLHQSYKSLHACSQLLLILVLLVFMKLSWTTAWTRCFILGGRSEVVIYQHNLSCCQQCVRIGLRNMVHSACTGPVPMTALSAD